MKSRRKRPLFPTPGFRHRLPATGYRLQATFPGLRPAGSVPEVPAKCPEMAAGDRRWEANRLEETGLRFRDAGEGEITDTSAPAGGTR